MLNSLCSIAISWFIVEDTNDATAATEGCSGVSDTDAVGSAVTLEADGMMRSSTPSKLGFTDGLGRHALGRASVQLSRDVLLAFRTEEEEANSFRSIRLQRNMGHTP
jgi:hypothetical protein